ncbi:MULTISPECIES: hypothetical protein [unclassified Streptomyces]|uniref:hypothetical protein n=2 Tax=Streptomyces TaxID=1883 RepID=UPI000ABF46AE|nr:hypothetical protein [Streptomyces sp. CB01883]
MLTDTAGRTTWTRVLRAAAALAVAGALTAAAGGDRAGGYAQGRALAGTGGLLGFDHARTGDEYWVSLPLQTGTGDESLTLLRTRWLRVPAGLEVLRYGVVTLGQMGGYGLVVADDETLNEDGPVRVGPERPVRVPPHAAARAYVLARVRVTGPVRGDLSGYRVWYRQGAVEYRQDLAWDVEIRLGPPLGRA